MLETRRRLVDRPCRNHATTDSEPKPARNQTRRELLKHDVDCSDAERRPFIAQAWKVIVLPGIRYMRQHSK